MILPTSLLDSLTGAPGFDRAAFQAVHADPVSLTSVRLNPLKATETASMIFGMECEPVPWSDLGHYLPVRPSFTFDPLFHAGLYYVQEASSMFLEQMIRSVLVPGKPVRVLDLSAAPGGKSTHLQSLISPDSLLVSNEIIRSRANILKDNMLKWGSSNVIVTHNDPADFARLENYFDIVVIDAPCSGSGLFRREPDAIDHWSENNVTLCAQRQQRILADAYPSLKKGGTLIYSTCSYSVQEDEDILDWLMQQFALESIPPNMMPAPLQSPGAGILPVHGKRGGMGYRFWPDRVKGEGFFITMLQKQDGEADFAGRARNKAEPLVRKELDLLAPWVQREGLEFIRHEQTVYAWPAAVAEQFSLLLNKMRVIYSGNIVGELKHDKLVPDHSLAMSVIAVQEISNWELDHEQAIAYLQRKDFPINASRKGWQLVTYRQHPLGWVNVLPNRLNNYYPKEFRILRETAR